MNFSYQYRLISPCAFRMLCTTTQVHGTLSNNAYTMLVSHSGLKRAATLKIKEKKKETRTPKESEEKSEKEREKRPKAK